MGFLGGRKGFKRGRGRGWLVCGVVRIWRGFLKGSSLTGFSCCFEVVEGLCFVMDMDNL